MVEHQERRQGEGERPPPPEPGKFAKDGEQPTPQPAMRINDRKKIQIFVKFFQIFIKIFLKTFKIFNKIFKICSKLNKFFQNTVINLIYDRVYLNCSKLLQTLIIFIKFSRLLNIFKNFLKNFLI